MWGWKVNRPSMISIQLFIENVKMSIKQKRLVNIGSHGLSRISFPSGVLRWPCAPLIPYLSPACRRGDKGRWGGPALLPCPGAPVIFSPTRGECRMGARRHVLCARPHAPISWRL